MTIDSSPQPKFFFLVLGLEPTSAQSRFPLYLIYTIQRVHVAWIITATPPEPIPKVARLGSKEMVVDQFDRDVTFISLLFVFLQNKDSSKRKLHFYVITFFSNAVFRKWKRFYRNFYCKCCRYKKCRLHIFLEKPNSGLPQVILVGCVSRWN